jgi:hypothetical protein
MDLVNQTPAPAYAVLTTGIPEDGPRMGMIVAKATFTFDAEGGVELDTQNPHPLYDSDEATELGLLPGDSLPRRDSAFEVILLGKAHAPWGRPVPSMTVRLSVGEVARSMAVFGERAWRPDGGMGSPEPFTEMPLVYERAFGGTAEVHLDEDTTLQVQDPINPLGRGFDADTRALEMGRGIGVPDGYPLLAVDRALPNLEDPGALIRSRQDAPDPVGWATVPMGMGLGSLRHIRELQEYGEIRDPRRSEIELYHRAHPHWVIDLPQAGAGVILEGLTPEGQIQFRLPELRVVADYVMGKRNGTRELAPQMLVLLPEERRFYLVYRNAFTAEVEPDMERSFRLRLEKGWYRYPDGAGTRGAE